MAAKEVKPTPAPKATMGSMLKYLLSMDWLERVSMVLAALERRCLALEFDDVVWRSRVALTM
jgi:hypothetical protein